MATYKKGTNGWAIEPTLDQLIHATGKAKKGEPVTTATLMRCIERLKAPTHYIDVEKKEKIPAAWLNDHMEQAFETTGGEMTEIEFDALIELEPVSYRLGVDGLGDFEATQL